MFIRHFLLAYCILLLSLSAFAVHYDPNPEEAAGYRYRKPRTEDLENFAGQNVVVIYRGIHFLPANFNYDERLSFIQESQVHEPMYAPATYELAREGYGSKEYEELDLWGQEIAGLVNRLDDTGECVVEGQTFRSARYAFQQLYSNNAKKFFKELDFPSDDYNIIFEDMDIRANPLLSGSDEVRHPAKYGFGLKNYGSNEPLLPLYDLNGRPQHHTLGKLYGIVLDPAAVEELKPMNVAKAHAEGCLRLHTHQRMNILSEREISIAGYIPEECVVFEMPLQVPSFTGDYPQYYEKKYGLTEKRYNNFKPFFTNADKTPDQRRDKSRKLMESIIKAGQDDKQGVYKNCIVERIPTMFKNALENIDARIGTLNLNYEIE